MMQSKRPINAAMVESHFGCATPIRRFRAVFLGNDPYLGWAITAIAGGIIADPIFHYAQRLGISKGRLQGVVILLFS